MSNSSNTENTQLTAEPTVPAEAGLSPLDRRRARRARAAWWLKIILQPFLAVTLIVLLIVGFGMAQRWGWIGSRDSGTAVASADEDVWYICPMVCVEPTREPGDCPVCGMELKAQKSSGDDTDRVGLNLDPGSIRVANIRTTPARAEILEKRIRAVGQVSYDEGSQATISAYVDGRIEKMFADYTGVRVAQGDELALLYSPDLYTSQIALLEARNLLDQSTSVNERIQSGTRRLYESSRQRLIEMGLTEKQVEELETRGRADSRIRIVSPMTGTVIEKLAVDGQYVKTGQPLYRIADLSTVWLMLELFPGDAAAVRFGQKVVTKFQSLPGQEFVGRVAFVDPTVDQKTQTAQVRVVVPNKSGLIRIGDFATATITTRSTLPTEQPSAIYDPELAGKWISPRHPQIIRDEPGTCPECGMDLVPASEFGFASEPVVGFEQVVVPRSAVLMAGDDSVVYVETEPGRFEFRPVSVGSIVGDQVAIVDGVSAGEMVVSNAVMLVDSQFSMAGKPSLLDPTKAQPMEPSEIDLMNSPELMAALSDLSESDRHEVLKQKICPVTEELLGSMGTPLVVNVADQRVWICCRGCEKRLLDNPQTYLAVLESYAQGDREQDHEIALALADLSDADRTLVEQQQICPVGEMPLGSMGTPIRVDVNGRPVFICCEGCRKSLLNEPEKYLAILDDALRRRPSGDPGLPEIEPFDEDLAETELPAIQALGESDDANHDPDIVAALASLDEAEQQIAAQQKICPVTKLPLGSMGTPLKVTVSGREVLICCEACRKRLLENPPKYLADLPEDPPK